jgi:hypothetical protein
MASTFSRTRLSLLVICFATAAVPPSATAWGEKGKTPSLSTLKALLGKGPESKELTDFRKELKGAPEVSKFEDCFYHEWKRYGISFRFVKGTVSAIFLYAEGADQYKQYQGELPEGA